MKASWWQTLVLAVISSSLPYVLAVASGGTITYRTAIASIIAAVMTSVSNMLRSPITNPPTMIQSTPATVVTTTETVAPPKP